MASKINDVKFEYTPNLVSREQILNRILQWIARYNTIEPSQIFVYSNDYNSEFFYNIVNIRVHKRRLQDLTNKSNEVKELLKKIYL